MNQIPSEKFTPLTVKPKKQTPDALRILGIVLMSYSGLEALVLLVALIILLVRFGEIGNAGGEGIIYAVFALCWFWIGNGIWQSRRSAVRVLDILLAIQVAWALFGLSQWDSYGISDLTRQVTIIALLDALLLKIPIAIVGYIKRRDLR